jgi:SAM-dependent methyltransferase
MNISVLPIGELLSATFWERAWAEVHRHSFLQTSQKTHPERWQLFYEEAGPLLRAVSGFSDRQGRDVVKAMFREGVIGPGQSAVDLGCGTGWLALPLASMGASVLAVDQSRSMLQEIQNAAALRKLGAVTTCENCWTELALAEPLDLALAAFFPEVLSPEGFQRMEGLGRRCAVILGSGIKSLPWTGPLWGELLGSVPSGGTQQVQTALNWLMAANRRPNLRQMTMDSLVNLPLDTMLSFYQLYFAMFGREGESIHAQLHRVLHPFSLDGRVTGRGQIQLSLIWWTSPGGVNADDHIPA